MITASKLNRLAICPGSHALPQTYSTSEAADRGIWLHKYLETRNIEDIPEQWRQDCENIDLSQLPDHKSYAAEVTFAYDPVSGIARELGRGLEREYKTLHEEIPGTVDAFSVTADTVVVLDWKTGWSAPHPRHNRQVKFLAMAAARSYQKTNAVGGIVRILGNGDARYEMAEWDAWALDEIEEEVKDIYERVRLSIEELDGGTIPSTREGDHCKYCPAYPHCPAKAALVVSLGKGEASRELTSKTWELELTPETASDAWNKLTQFETLAKKVREALQEYASHTPFPTSEGKILASVEETRESVSMGPALEALEAQGVGAEVMQPKTITKKAIDDALRPVAKERGTPLAALRREVMSSIDELGGVTRKTFRRVKEIKR